MGDPRSNGSELDRRDSHRTSTRLSTVLGDRDDDDYVLQAMAISDGFRPVEVTQDHNASPISRPSVSPFERPVAPTIAPRPSSVAKPPPAHESFLPYHQLERSPARSSGASTDSATVAAETPYEGPSGPSHPYQMYPQDVRVARSASLATTSTAPISERSYHGPGRPTHPYAIYTQNVAAGIDGTGASLPQSEINVGFPGTSADYRRRLGPDGEEAADMIGPDGHTEQLPPYTRYPVEAYAQKALDTTATPSPLPSSPARQNLEIPGAGGIGLATRNPEFSSTEDLNQLNPPQSRRSVRSFVSEASHHSINTAALAVVNEKREPDWKVAARRKVWGVIPCWAMVLAVVVLVMLGVILGTVIGTVVAHWNNKRPDHDDGPPYAATNSIPGFAPLSTVPPGLSPLVQGPFSLPLMGARFSNTCFQDPSQGNAWSCDAIMSQLYINISQRHDATPLTAYMLDFTYNQSWTPDSNVYTYGVQPPSLKNLQLQLVNDTFERSRGPAWAFALPYDKTIILPEELLKPNDSSSGDKVRRRMFFGSDFKRKNLAKAGEKPWICTWPGTLLEVFIYADQTSSFKFPPPGSSSTTPSSSPLPTESSTGDQSSSSYRREVRGGGHGGDDYPHTGSPPNGPPSGSSAGSSASSSTSSSTSSSASSSTSSLTESSSSSTTPSTTPTPSPSGMGIPDYWGPPPPQYPPYPKVIKVEERRNSEVGGPVPVCRQVEIGDKGVPAKPVLDDDGKPVEVRITEVVAEEEKESEYYRENRSSEKHLWGRDDGGSEGNELSDCGCIWWIT